MPLLKKTEFHKVSLPDGFRDNEEVFHCPMTNEIFRDYDEFCARVILCNSMVWTCSYTGKTGLTYSEAIDSENHAKQLLKDFPTELRIPVIFLASKTQRSSFNEMLEDVYGYIKDRYFIGENVEASFSGNKWHESHILQVIAPSEESIKKAPKNGQAADSSYGPPATLYHYEVEQLDPEDQDLSEVMIVSYDRIRRKKRLSRDKLKLFLKQYVEQNELGVIVIKPSVLEKFGIYKVRFDQIFEGSTPHFDVSKKLTRNGRNVRQATLVPFLKSKGSSESKAKSVNGVKSKETTSSVGLSENSPNLLEKMRKRQEDFKQKREDLKQKRAEDRLKQKEENLKLSLMLKQWYRPKDDLELEDHKILPVPAPVCTQIPDEYMGDVFTILEFVKTFSKFLSVNSFFPGGLTLELLERALLQKEVAGPLMDLIQMLLTALFNAQIDESSQYNTKLDSNSGIKGRDYNDNVSLTEASHFATLASTWSTTYQGTPLNNIPLYSLTTSEILRLHLLSSGARINDTGARWRYQYRGGYTSEDDPGLYFRLKNPHILKALALHSLVELPVEDILKVIDCLMTQLLTYADVRDLVEDQLEKSRQLKVDYKALQVAERKQEQEYITAKLKIKKEAKESNTDPTEQLDKLAKEIEEKKGENEKKQNHLLNESNKHQVYLGVDRAFRRYLKLKSVPGVFVNFEEDNPGYCYEECIQQNPDLVNAGRTEVIAHLRKIQEETNTSDKENTVEAKILPNNITNGEVADVDLSKPTNDPDKLLICNSNPETCIVHSSKVSRVKWSFFHDPEQISDLINSVNVRGIHEGELKQALINDQKCLTHLVEETPISVLNPKLAEALDENKTEGEQKSKSSKSKGKPKYEDANLGYPKDLSIALVLQYALVENILDIEEKIFAGNLGSIKVKDRSAWRDHLANHRYHMLDKTLRKDKKPANKIKEDASNSRSSTPDLSKEYKDPGIFLGATVEVDLNDAANNTSSDSLLLQPEDHKLAIQTLACALAQVAEGVDERYLKKPLGTINTRGDANKMVSGLFDKWMDSLLASTSYCQICLHYSTLDNCILWSRSALLARCHVCRKQRDSENMLLCDNCNRGQHLYCHKPKLKTIPKGNWYCIECRRQKEKEEKPKVPQKRRRIFVEDEDEETSEQSDNIVNEKKFEKKATKTSKRRKVSTDEEESSEQSDIFNGRKGNRRSKKRIPLIVEEEDSSSEQQSDVAAEDPLALEGSPSHEDLAGDGDSSEDSDNSEDIEKEDEETDESEDDEPEEADVENGEVEESEIEEQEEEDDEEMEEDNKTVVENKVVQNGNTRSSEISEDEVVNGDGQILEVCEKCGFGGTLLCCDNCPELYHLECANPPLRRVPRGEWFCHKCKSSKKKEEPDNSRRSIRRDDLPLNNAQLQEVLTEVMKQEFAWPFLRPVNKHEVPDYYDIIGNPMDFGTIKYKLNMGTYKFDADLMADVALVFENCKLYNNSSDEVFQCGLKLLQHFVDKCHELGLHVPHALRSKEVLLAEDDKSSTKSDLEEKMQVD